jgi:hypothetical protein
MIVLGSHNGTWNSPTMFFEIFERASFWGRQRVDDQPGGQVDALRLDRSPFERFHDRFDDAGGDRRVLDDVLREADRRVTGGLFEEEFRGHRRALRRFIRYAGSRLPAVCRGSRFVLRRDDVAGVGHRRGGTESKYQQRCGKREQRNRSARTLIRPSSKTLPKDKTR